MPHRSVAKTRTKQMACDVCGSPTTVGSNTRKAPKCVECAVTAAIDNLTQIRNRSGPYYEKWIAGVLGIPVDPTWGEGRGANRDSTV